MKKRSMRAAAVPAAAVAAGILAACIALGLAACAVNRFYLTPDVVLGEKEPLLEGTIWRDTSNTNNYLFQFHAGGELVFVSPMGTTDQNKWSRQGDRVILFVGKWGEGEGEDWYQSLWQGTCDAAAKTIRGSWQNFGGVSYAFTLEPHLTDF
ncbi:MAG: hypothetical protein LBQ55_01930 [Treponema sp.]|jgi:hypothetical protein|nr:hypothetical protein [Treponema sp.]